jgi:hypothetical protein
MPVPFHNQFRMYTFLTISGWSLWPEDRPMASYLRRPTQHTKSCTSIHTTSRVQTQISDFPVVLNWTHSVSGIASDLYSWSTRFKSRWNLCLDKIFVVSIGLFRNAGECIKSHNDRAFAYAFQFFIYLLTSHHSTLHSLLDWQLLYIIYQHKTVYYFIIIFR